MLRFDAFLNDTIKGNARGGIYENVIAECLVKRGYSLYYFRPYDDHGLEFLIKKEGEVIPIEVKAGNNATLLRYFPLRKVKKMGGGHRPPPT